MQGGHKKSIRGLTKPEFLIVASALVYSDFTS